MKMDLTYCMSIEEEHLHGRRNSDHLGDVGVDCLDHIHVDLSRLLSRLSEDGFSCFGVRN